MLKAIESGGILVQIEAHRLRSLISQHIIEQISDKLKC